MKYTERDSPHTEKRPASHSHTSLEDAVVRISVARKSSLAFLIPVIPRITMRGYIYN